VYNKLVLPVVILKDRKVGTLLCETAPNTPPCYEDFKVTSVHYIFLAYGCDISAETGGHLFSCLEKTR